MLLPYNVEVQDDQFKHTVPFKEQPNPHTEALHRFLRYRNDILYDFSAIYYRINFVNYWC